MSVDTPQQAGLVLDPCPKLHLVMTATGVIQGNVSVVRPVGRMSVESMTSLMGQDIQTSHTRAPLVGQEIQTSHTRALLVAQEIQTNLPKALGWKEVVIEEKEAFILVEAP